MKIAITGHSEGIGNDIYVNLIKEYDSENDYALYDEEDISQLTLAKGYFAIIDPTVAHMAMLGEGSMSKLVFKIRK